ncbi:unnamed protein product (macronuclear) [Paramecium tetraurelia]|uniref:Uncharacterized protein n=1 Tax=Paramecium tetraurelia TaxID=5888 RepID=A0E473_PARTE|nr:uncharacterized protein GSPATT00023264001 [Paramecium tetraurelia]CAK90090.1 unnamed protein product [Paramecium tetraurelia]|eukprot:XP_001457487.1 hypothetical protein (macronuclear) [Paramecium tetraurelia strain d4-2]
MQSNHKITPNNPFYKGTYPQTILVKDKQQPSKTRYDRQSQPIIRGKGNQAVTFKHDIHQIYTVENWKIYKIENETQPNENKCCFII